VHIAVGCLCLRLDGGEEVKRGLAGLQDGDFARVEVRLSDKRRFVVEGRTAWYWAPSMTGGDNAASLGIDILGATEEDSTLWGKLRGLLSREPPLTFDRTPRLIATRQETSEPHE
jgi:hypothetical protein